MRGSVRGTLSNQCSYRVGIWNHYWTEDFMKTFMAIVAGIGATIVFFVQVLPWATDHENFPSLYRSLFPLNIAGEWSSLSTCNDFCGGDVSIRVLNDEHNIEKTYDGSFNHIDQKKRCESKKGRNKKKYYNNASWDGNTLEYWHKKQKYTLSYSSSSMLEGKSEGECKYSLARKKSPNRLPNKTN